VSAYIRVDLQRRIREHFANRCAYCRTAESLTVSLFEIEHIVPRSAGGETAFENLCLACPTCNRFKADRQSIRDETGREAALFHPQRDLWSDHFAWSADGTEVVLRMNRPQLLRVRQMWVAMDEHPPEIG
jgi:5-methylcytosine-specific restriction endonuclease McrA